MTYKIFAAMKAFIVFEEKILFIKESSKYADWTQSWKYNDIWGRVEPGERFNESLLREIKEETWLDVKVWSPFFVNEWRPEIRWEKRQIIATYFECFAENDEVKLGEDHEDFIWIDPKKYKEYPLVENLHETIEAYLEFKWLK